MAKRQFGFPKTRAGKAMAALVSWSVSWGRAAIRYEPGVGLTVLWHGWEHGREGQRRPLPLVPPREIWHE